MKKKVVVSFEDGDLIFRGCHNEDDGYFVNLYNSIAIKITRQYYPLKDNKEEVIFRKDKSN